MIAPPRPVVPPSSLLLVVVALFAVGCATADERDDYIQPGTTDLVVENLEFEGVEAVSERQLRRGLATIEDPGWRADPQWAWLPLIGDRRRFFNRFAWQQDRERILAFYRQQGYYNASIDSESFDEDHEQDTIRVHVEINEGQPTRVEQLRVHGLIEGEMPSPQQLLEELPLGEGDVFVQQDYRQTRQMLQQRMRQAGFAYAEIDGRVFIDRDTDSAEVFFFVEPGPKSRMGPVYVVGLEDVDERSVRRAIPFQEGDDYSPQTLERAREDIEDLGVFAMVTVLPAHEARDARMDRPEDRRRIEQIEQRHDLPDQPDDTDESDPEISSSTDGQRSPLGISRLLADAQQRAETRARLDPEVPIVVRVQEATGPRLRVGAGLAAEGTRQDVRGLANWSARYPLRGLFGGPEQIEFLSAAGYAWAPGLLGLDERINEGVILSTQLEFTQTQFIERRTNLRLRGSIDRDIREGFSLWNPAARLALERPLTRHLLVGASYNVAYFNFSNVQRGLIDPTATELGLDFETEFLLEHFEQSIAYDRRDDVINPFEGFLLDLTLQQAGGFAFGGEFDFIKPILSGEFYQPIGWPLPSTLALRARLGTVYDIGRDTGVPVQNRLYSGGTDGMRSFGRRRLSLYTATGEPVPIGGLTQLETSVEPRWQLLADLMDVGDLWATVFLDAATVLGGQLLMDTDPNVHGVVGHRDLFASLLWGVGAGLWWDTPVGPVRLDGAYTITDIDEDPRFRRCENPADYMTPRCQFVPLEQDPIQDLIHGWGVYLSIGHSF